MFAVGHQSGQRPFGLASTATERGVAVAHATSGVSAREGAELPDVSTSNQPKAAGHPSPSTVGFRVGSDCSLQLLQVKNQPFTCSYKGGPPGARTRHLGIKSPLLYQMS
jgi:hypothetical protein